MGERILSFRDLRVYHLAFQLQQEVFEITKSFPMEERFSLTDQFRRASRSIGANISEVWQKRRYLAHFISKLSDADGELAETQHWISTTAACHYISGNQEKELLAKCTEVGRMLGTIMATPEKFCHAAS